MKHILTAEDVFKYVVLLAMRGQYGFSGCTFNDNIYIIPFGNKAYSGTGEFYTVREDILDEIGMKASDITTIDQLLECFERQKKIVPIGQGRKHNYL